MSQKIFFQDMIIDFLLLNYLAANLEKVYGINRTSMFTAPCITHSGYLLRQIYIPFM